MKTWEKIVYPICFIFALYMFYIGATLAFMTEFYSLAWPMVLGGAWVLGEIAYHMIKDIFEI
jgi:hypothetical protein